MTKDKDKKTPVARKYSATRPSASSRPAPSSRERGSQAKGVPSTSSERAHKPTRRKAASPSKSAAAAAKARSAAKPKQTAVKQTTTRRVNPNIEKRGIGSKIQAAREGKAPVAKTPASSGPTRRVSKDPSQIRDVTSTTGAHSPVKLGTTASNPKVDTSRFAAQGQQKSLPGSRVRGLVKPVSTGTLKVPAAAPKADKKPMQSFKDFFMSHLRVMVPVAAIVILFLGFGVYDMGASIGRIHPGVSVQGVDVGGLSVDDAASKLESELGNSMASKVIAYQSSDTAIYDGLSIDDSTNASVAYAATSSGKDADGDGKKDKWSINPSTIGAYIDGQALAAEAYKVGRSGNFIAERFGAWTNGVYINAWLSFNAELFNSLVEEINNSIGSKAKDSKASITSKGAKLKKGSDGELVDEEAFKKKISAASFNKSTPYCTIPLHTVTRSISDETAQAVVDQINNAVSQDVVITYEGESWTMSKSDLCDVLGQKVLQPDQVLTLGNSTQKVETASSDVKAKYDVSAGTDAGSGYILQAYVDQKKMDEWLADALGDKSKGGAKNAKFVISGGKVTIKESKTGTGPDRAAAALQVQDILFGGSSSNRTVNMAETTIEPELTTEEASSMGIKEKLSSWSIPLSGSESRIHNIKLLCKLINGSLVKPGETWSFNQTTGERTSEKGFKTAPVIVGGKHEDQLGGGICQVATCIFNSACYAGLGIGTRANHAFYIPMYDDEGFADATVSWEEPDLQFVNDMQNYIYIRAVASDGDVKISFWGTSEGRTITCDRGEWKKGTKYRTIKENDDELAAGTTKVEQTGSDGRSINIRYIAKDADGNVLHDIDFHSVYEAQNEIIKVGTKTESSSKSSGDSKE